MRNPPQTVPSLQHPDALRGIGFGTFWRYRDLVRNLVAKDIKVRYMGALLGFIWALINPLMITLMYLVIFTYIFPQGVPRFALYLVTGMVHWMLFSNVVIQGPDLLVANAGLIKKISFPRILVPFSNLLVNITLWLFAFCAYILLFPLLGGQVSLAILAYPIYFLLFVLFTFGISLILSILYVHFRDIKHIVEIVLQVAFWSAPIVYTQAMVPHEALQFYKLNPLVEFVIIFERIWYQNALPSLHLTLAFAAWTFGMLGVGFWLFVHWAHRLIEDL